MVDTVRRRRLPAQERREAILDAALELFGQRSYDAVGMRDLAAACDLSATGIYRHFPNKEALLIGLFDRLADQITHGMRAASRATAPPEQLDLLVRFHVDQVLREPALIPIYQREEASLPPAERHRLREILRAYLAAWTDLLTTLRPDLPAAEARTTVVSVFGLLNSTAYHRTQLSQLALGRLLTELTRRTLGLPPG